MGVAFDALGAAETSADMTLSLLLNVERANRLVQQHSLNPQNLGLQEVLDVLPLNRIYNRLVSRYEAEVFRTVKVTVVNNLIGLLRNNKAIPQVKELVNAKLDSILKKEKEISSQLDMESTEVERIIETFRDDPNEFEITSAPQIPDGSPIGMDCAGPNYNH